MPFLIEIVIVLIVVGLALYIIEMIPMDATIARVIRIVIIVAVAIWLLSLLIGYLPSGSFGYPHHS